MAKPGGPAAPRHLVEAAFFVYGRRCILPGCDVDDVVEVAHVAKWQTTLQQAVADVGFPIKHSAPIDELVHRYARARRNHLGMVVPLCPNDHTRFDDPRNPRVTEHEVHDAREAALAKPEVLDRLVEFVCAQVAGRRHRGVVKPANGQPYTTPFEAIQFPMARLGQAYGTGTVKSGAHRWVVPTPDGGHAHVDLAVPSLVACLGDLRGCLAWGQLWQASVRARQSRAGATDS